ncbi:MAG: D-alanyl-D-alanine carboxypeptidase/D-alanyl-D-alanine-endopeptidase [Planctomycetes bacterium]|nr:D-alanyl-D-alanine carboxypeptidase/D-alanyl-D-alanine-endopeptidase [Planctomycetota bacterium]
MRLFSRNLPFYLLGALLLLAAQNPVRSDNAGLDATTRSAILAKLQKAEGKRGTAGCVILDLDSGETLLSHNADTALIPASNMKLVTTLTALDQLGGDFEFVTRVLADGKVEGGALNGDLLVIGGGDPNLSGRFYENDPLALFKAWAARLKQTGITSISGDLKYDSTLFGGESFCEGWPQDDQYIKWYCAEVSALAFNDNCVGIRVIPTSAGKPAKIEVMPETAYVTIVNETTTARGKKGAEIGIVRPRGENTITVKGTVYEQATWGYFIDVTVHDPAAYAATVLKETLAREGVSLKGAIKPVTLSNQDMQRCTLLIEHRASLLQALKPINTNSQNLHAEMLFRQLGLRYSGKGTFKTGRAAVEAYLTEQKLLTDGIHIEDGSGLARDNRVTPNLLVKLLKRAAADERFEALRDSLAVGGEAGTLEKRLTDKSVKGKVFAKTGYINNVRSLSGYLFAGKRRFAFSMLMNDCVYTKQMQDEILEILAKAAE